MEYILSKGDRPVSIEQLPDDSLDAGDRLRELAWYAEEEYIKVIKITYEDNR